VQLVAFAEQGQVVLHDGDGPTWGVNTEKVGPVGQSGDGSAGSEQGAWAEVVFPVGELVVAGVQQGGIEDVGPAVQLTGRGPEAGGPDLVSADDEVVEVIEVQGSKQWLSGDQGGGVGQAAAQGGQPKGSRGTDTACGTEQPQTDAAGCHDDSRYVGP